jgi:DNA sulfur modification protein DndE
MEITISFVIELDKSHLYMKNYKPFYLLPFLAILFISFQSPKTTIFMIGDSTMANKKAANFPETGWGQVLPAFADTSRIIIDNHALNGRSTKSFIDEGCWQKVIDAVKPGDYVFIQFGHNDEKIKNAKVYAQAETSYKQNLERFISETIAKGGKPVLFTSIVRRNFDESGILNDTHGNYPEVVKQVALEQCVPVIDMESLTKLMVEHYGIEGSKTLFLQCQKGQYENYPNGVEDNTHLNRKGAIEVAALAVQSIKKQIPELASCF